MTSVTVRVPAKLNLGLAITGKRPDGFHDLVSIMQAIDLCDVLTLTRLSPGGPPSCTVGEVTTILPEQADDPVVLSGDNLAARAVVAAAGAAGAGGAWRLSLDKAIPAASGLGGASADAAGGIVAVESILGRAVPEREAVALSLGSDVPFFLTGGAALVGGRGDIVEPVPCPAGTSFIVVFPRRTREIPRKTEALYGALIPTDFASGADVWDQVARLRAGQGFDPALLTNGFDRALVSLIPELGDLRSVVRHVAGHDAALSGAGPTHYLVETDPDRAADLAGRLSEALGDRTLIRVVRPSAGPPLIVG